VYAWVPVPRGLPGGLRKASEKLPGVDDSVCSSFGYSFGDWWREAESWSWYGGRDQCTVKQKQSRYTPWRRLGGEEI
jgi:hypothetical protein